MEKSSVHFSLTNWCSPLNEMEIIFSEIGPFLPKFSPKEWTFTGKILLTGKGDLVFTYTYLYLFSETLWKIVISSRFSSFLHTIFCVDMANMASRAILYLPYRTLIWGCVPGYSSPPLMYRLGNLRDIASNFFRMPGEIAKEFCTPPPMTIENHLKTAIPLKHENVWLLA